MRRGRKLREEGTLGLAVASDFGQTSSSEKKKRVRREQKKKGKTREKKETQR